MIELYKKYQHSLDVNLKDFHKLIIHPKNLELDRSNNNIFNANFLDLNIYLNKSSCITIDLYDKRSDFKFKIAKF